MHNTGLKYAIKLLWFFIWNDHYITNRWSKIFLCRSIAANKWKNDKIVSSIFYSKSWIIKSRHQALVAANITKRDSQVFFAFWCRMQNYLGEVLPKNLTLIYLSKPTIHSLMHKKHKRAEEHIKLNHDVNWYWKNKLVSSTNKLQE